MAQHGPFANVDSKLNLVFCTDSFSECINQPGRNLVGVQLSRLIHPDLHEILAAQLSDLAAKTVTRAVVFQMWAATRQWMPVQLQWFIHSDNRIWVQAKSVGLQIPFEVSTAAPIGHPQTAPAEPQVTPAEPQLAGQAEWSPNEERHVEQLEDELLEGERLVGQSQEWAPAEATAMPPESLTATRYSGFEQAATQHQTAASAQAVASAQTQPRQLSADERYKARRATKTTIAETYLEIDANGEVFAVLGDWSELGGKTNAQKAVGALLNDENAFGGFLQKNLLRVKKQLIPAPLPGLDHTLYSFEKHAQAASN